MSELIGPLRPSDLLPSLPTTSRGPGGPQRVAPPGTDSALSPQKLADARRVARGFENTFLHRLMAAMRETVPDGGLLDDETGEGYEDLFWMHLTDLISDQGGLGIGKQVYREILRHEGQDAAATVEQLR